MTKKELHKLITESIHLIIEKKLCPKGKAYYNRRIAAGESPSAYLSGRAVKVCKGLMEEDIDLQNIKDKDEEIKKTSIDLNLPYDRIYNTFIQGKEVILTDEMWSRLENTNSYDVETLESTSINGKNKQSTTNTEHLPHAFILQYSPNKFYLVNGNNYLIRAKLQGINPNVILATIEPQAKWAYQNVTGEIDESLYDWFKKEDWVRIDTQGNITGPCGTMKKGKATTRCLPRAKANRLSKKERASTSRKKASADRKGDRVVSNTDKAKVKFRK